MNIGFFSPTINEVGGGELVALNMIDALRGRGHRIIIYSAEKIDTSRIKNFLGHSITFDEEVTIGPKLFNPYSLQCIYPNLGRSYLFHRKCDFVIDTFSDSIFPWTNAVYFNQYPRITKLPKNGLKGKILAPYAFFLEKSVKHADSRKIKLMTCSKFMAQKIEKLTGLFVNVLYPPVSQFFKLGVDISSKEDIVVSVFRMSAAKKPETIPEIAKLAKGNFSFVIIGNCRTADDMGILKRVQMLIYKLKLDKKVKLLINISREKQREILQKAKVYLHPSVPYEAFGISVAEAMSAGCVSIVPDVGGLKEIVTEQFRYNSLAEAAELIEKTINSWSPSLSFDSVKRVDKFSQAKFRENFMNIMQL
ncbi:MAG: glycosyltransferase family 4 protein [Candidatus Bathyarchaeota archaeon]|nr:glycosyltransferase family 4 protein [Candidatus Bathyarchaeota archaeon]